MNICTIIIMNLVRYIFISLFVLFVSVTNAFMLQMLFFKYLTALICIQIIIDNKYIINNNYY